SATLLHDDILDRGETRRGRPSALTTFGVADTLVAGDFLFSRAFALCARFEAEVIRWAAEACISLTEGEVMQGRFRHNPAVTIADYLEIIERKTASLFAAGARTAAPRWPRSRSSPSRRTGPRSSPSRTGSPNGRAEERPRLPQMPARAANGRARIDLLWPPTEDAPVPRDIEGLDAAARALGG